MMTKPNTAAANALETRLLVLFDQLYRTRSVTRAAEELELSQPTISVWLAKLRRQVHDPLFVRTARGMQPTARAEAMIGPAREALTLLQRLAGGEAPFDPATANRRFRLGMTDASHITLLPRLLAHVRAQAPDVRLEVTPITPDTPRLLAEGRADLALGFVPGLESAFHEQALYPQDFVCLVNASHPRIGRTLTLRGFREALHVGVLSSTSYTTLNIALAQAGIERRIFLELPGFLGLAAVVSSTDLIATVPRTIGETLARGGGVRVLPCPVKVPTFTVKQYWHARIHHDAGHRWLRSVCAHLFATAVARRHSGG